MFEAATGAGMMIASAIAIGFLFGLQYDDGPVMRNLPNETPLALLIFYIGALRFEPTAMKIIPLTEGYAAATMGIGMTLAFASAYLAYSVRRWFSRFRRG